MNNVWNLSPSKPTLPFRILPESAHWLAANNRLDEAEKVLQRAASINRVQIPEKCLTKVEEEDGSVWYINDEKTIKKDKFVMDTDSMKDVPLKRYTIIDVYRTPGLRVYATLMFLIW